MALPTWPCRPGAARRGLRLRDGTHRDVEGRKSIQSFCEARRVAPGAALHFEYMPAERSHSRRPVLLMTRTLGHADGRLQGAATAVIDLDIAQRWLEGVPTDSNAAMALLDREGTLLARNPPLPASRASDPALAANRAELALRGHGVLQTAATEDGRLRVAGVSPVGRLPFVAAVGYDVETALRGWHYRRLQFMAGFLVLSGLSFLALRIYLITLAQREKLRLQASTDPLTGAANRRAFQRSGQAEISRALRHGHALSLLMVDIDKFKLVNDSWGHPTGDRVIQALANTIQSLCRSHDLCGRLGGEEFAILLPQSDLAGAAALAERLRVAVEGMADVRSDNGQEVRFTISLGASTLHGQDDSLDALLQRADRALYQAKEAGRNRVVLEQA
ncbi:diguanylate cyclase [Roseateles sp. DB2]|uniref:GGDEF domain-containing protein n=1 Tax=Roseateles sp. DB2 TaxID=3453717 RepID=UPI003EEB2DEE